MRWELFFADLEAQAAAFDQAERGGEIDERARIELARVRLHDRLAASVTSPIRLRCPNQVTVAGVLAYVGSQWVLVDEPAGRQALVATSAIMAITGLGRRAAPPDALGVVASRLGLAHALRAISRDRSAVRVDLIDGSSLDGTIDRVGADFVELAVHAAGEPRRRAAVREVLLVALSSIAVVRRHGDG